MNQRKEKRKYVLNPESPALESDVLPSALRSYKKFISVYKGMGMSGLTSLKYIFNKH